MSFIKNRLIFWK